MKVTGVIGTPDIARSNKSNQMFFVNNRYIKDFKLSTAAEQAYREVLPSGKYAFLILNVKLDSKKVDVNVHPAKLEVRFEEEAEVFRAVYNAIKAGLATIAIKNKTQIEFEKPEIILDEKNITPVEKVKTAVATEVEAVSTNPVSTSISEEIKSEPIEEISKHAENTEAPKSKIAEILSKFKKDVEDKKQEEVENVELSTPEKEIESNEPAVYPKIEEQLKENKVEHSLVTPMVTNEDIIEKEVE